MKKLAVCLAFLLFVSGCGQKAPATSGALDKDATSPGNEKKVVEIKAPERVWKDGEYNCEKYQCISEADWKDLCSKVSGVTKGVVGQIAMFRAPDDGFAYLLNNGGFESAETVWKDGNAGSYKCEVILAVSGIYEGSTYRNSHDYSVRQVVVKNGEVLVSDIHNF